MPTPPDPPRKPSPSPARILAEIRPDGETSVHLAGSSRDLCFLLAAILSALVAQEAVGWDALSRLVEHLEENPMEGRVVQGGQQGQGKEQQA